MSELDSFPKGAEFVMVPNPEFAGHEIPAYLPRFRVEDFAAACPRCVCETQAIDGLTAFVGGSGIALALLGTLLLGYSAGRLKRIRKHIRPL